MESTICSWIWSDCGYASIFSRDLPGVYYRKSWSLWSTSSIPQRVVMELKFQRVSQKLVRVRESSWYGTHTKSPRTQKKLSEVLCRDESRKISSRIPPKRNEFRWVFRWSILLCRNRTQETTKRIFPTYFESSQYITTRNNILRWCSGEYRICQESLNTSCSL